MTATCALVGKITAAVLNPILLLVFAVGLLVFVFGLVEFMWGLGADSDKKKEGKQHMLWGVIGMFLMASAFAIVKVIAGLVGGTTPCF